MSEFDRDLYGGRQQRESDDGQNNPTHHCAGPIIGRRVAGKFVPFFWLCSPRYVRKTRPDLRVRFP
jgi:hypothetical protein